MRHFTDDIVEIEAQAGVGTPNRDELIPELGLERKQIQRQEVTLDYHRVPASGPENPLTDAAVDNIIHQLGRKLNDFDTDAEPDLAVSKLVVDATLPELTEVTRSTTDEYELTFISDPAETVPGVPRDPKGLTRLKNRGKGLYDDLGFNIRNLNLHAVEETRIKYGEQGNAKIMGWGGHDDVRPNSDNKLAQVIADQVCPEEFAKMKWYDVISDDTIELAMMGDNS
jgi:hypothetical protein